MTTLYTNLGYTEFSGFRYNKLNGYLHFHVHEAYPNGAHDEYNETINTHYYDNITSLDESTWKSLSYSPNQSYLLQFKNADQTIDLRQTLLDNHAYHYAISDIYVDKKHHLVIISHINETIRIPLQDIPEFNTHNSGFIAKNIEQVHEALFIKDTDIAISLNGLIEKHTKGTPSYLRRP